MHSLNKKSCLDKYAQNFVDFFDSKTFVKTYHYVKKTHQVLSKVNYSLKFSFKLL